MFNSMNSKGKLYLVKEIPAVEKEGRAEETLVTKKATTIKGRVHCPAALLHQPRHTQASCALSLHPRRTPRSR